MATKRTTVAVLGGGNAAFAAAADLKLRGFTVHLLEVPELSSNLAGVREQGGIELLAAEAVGIRSGLAKVDVVTDDPKEALAAAEIVLYAVPAFAERRFTELCAPNFREDQLVVLFCGNLGAAFELANILCSRGDRTLPTIAQTEGLVYAAFKQGPASVRVLAIKKGLTLAALRPERTAIALQRLESLYPDFLPAFNVLDAGLRSLNPVIHPVVSLLNAGRVGKGKPKWRYYWEGVADEVGKLVEQIDRERRAVGEAAGLDLPPALDVLRRWYPQRQIQWQTLAEALSTNPVYENVWAPEMLDHRYLTEDVPFGLVPLEALAQHAGVEVSAVSAVITLCSQLMGTDFRAHGRNLKRLGLKDCGQNLIQGILGNKSLAEGS